MSNSNTCSEQKTLDREREIYQKEIVRQLAELVNRLDRVEQALTDKLNESYRQGVADERKHRTGRDLKVDDDD
jgi:hypothetical protein